MKIYSDLYSASLLKVSSRTVAQYFEAVFRISLVWVWHLYFRTTQSIDVYFGTTNSLRTNIGRPSLVLVLMKGLGE